MLPFGYFDAYALNRHIGDPELNQSLALRNRDMKSGNIMPFYCSLEFRKEHQYATMLAAILVSVHPVTGCAT
jgi:hypothetical protein